MKTLWAAQWHSHNKLDGDHKHIIYENCVPQLFRTRREAREYINTKFGYIRTRPDLKTEPHGWRIPVAVKVTLDVTT